MSQRSVAETQFLRLRFLFNSCLDKVCQHVIHKHHSNLKMSENN